jgi:hypothetical protein
MDLDLEVEEEGLDPEGEGEEVGEAVDEEVGDVRVEFVVRKAFQLSLHNPGFSIAALGHQDSVF